MNVLLRWMSWVFCFRKFYYNFLLPIKSTKKISNSWFLIFFIEPKIKKREEMILLANKRIQKVDFFILFLFFPRYKNSKKNLVTCFSYEHKCQKRVSPPYFLRYRILKVLYSNSFAKRILKKVYILTLLNIKISKKFSL